MHIYILWSVSNNKLTFDFFSSHPNHCREHGKDERYKQIEKSRDRESMFNDHIADLRKREKEEKEEKRKNAKKEFKVINIFPLLFNLPFSH